MSKKFRSTLIRLFESRQRELYLAALSVTRERGSAEDAVQDAIIAVASVQTQPDNLEAYLFRAVRNKALHHLDRIKRIDDTVDAADFLDLGNCSNESQILARQVVKRMDELSLEQRQVIIMKLFGDLTFDEIARITDTSLNTVASWYRRGLEKLREQIYEQEV